MAKRRFLASALIIAKRYLAPPILNEVASYSNNTIPYSDVQAGLAIPGNFYNSNSFIATLLNSFSFPGTQGMASLSALDEMNRLPGSRPAQRNMIPHELWAKRPTGPCGCQP